MDGQRQAEVLDYMRTDETDQRAIGCIKSAICYLEGAGIIDDRSDGYLQSVKSLALSYYDIEPLPREGQRLINQRELLGEVSGYGI